MFECQHQRATLFTYPLLFSDKERRPLGVILDESNNTRFKTQRVRHRISIRDSKAARGAEIEGETKGRPPHLGAEQVGKTAGRQERHFRRLVERIRRSSDARMASRTVLTRGSRRRIGAGPGLRRFTDRRTSAPRARILATPVKASPAIPR